MKQSVAAPGRLASAHSVRTLRRNSSGIAEKICVGISFGGVSRYIIFFVHLSQRNRRTLNDIIQAVDWRSLRHCEEQSDEAIHRATESKEWIASLRSQ
jgi:hypothetical protein